MRGVFKVRVDNTKWGTFLKIFITSWTPCLGNIQYYLLPLQLLQHLPIDIFSFHKAFPVDDWMNFFDSMENWWQIKYKKYNNLKFSCLMRKSGLTIMNQRFNMVFLKKSKVWNFLIPRKNSMHSIWKET